MSMNYFKHNSFFGGRGTHESVAHQPLGSNRSSGVTDLSAPSPSALNEVDYGAINTLFDGYDYNTSQTTMTGGFRSNVTNGAVWAVISQGNIAENPTGAYTNPAGNVTVVGQFDRGTFDSPSTYPIQPSNFPGLTKGCLWFCLSLWAPGAPLFGTKTHMGDIYLNFPDYPADGSTKGLQHLFTPAVSKRVEAFVVYGAWHGDANNASLAGSSYHYESGYTETFTATHNQMWMLSSEANPTSNGYYIDGSGSARFSAQDGVWGFRVNRNVAGGHQDLGQFAMALSSAQGNDKSFGVQNYNSTDSGTTSDDVRFGENYVLNNTNWKGMLWTVTA